MLLFGEYFKIMQFNESGTNKGGEQFVFMVRSI